MIKNTTLEELNLTFTPWSNEREKDVVLNLIEEGSYTSLIALENGWICETNDLDIHKDSLEECL